MATLTTSLKISIGIYDSTVDHLLENSEEFKKYLFISF